MPNRSRDPRTKEELLDRMMSFDFDGDIRHLGVEVASITREGPNRLRLVFPNSGKAFELSIHIPRELGLNHEARSFQTTHEEPPQPPPPPPSAASPPEPPEKPPRRGAYKTRRQRTREARA